MSADFSKETLLEGIGKKYSNHEKQGPTAKIALPRKDIRADKELPRQEKTKGVHHHQTIIICNVKGTYLGKRRSKL